MSSLFSRLTVSEAENPALNDRRSSRCTSLCVHQVAATHRGFLSSPRALGRAGRQGQSRPGVSQLVNGARKLETGRQKSDSKATIRLKQCWSWKIRDNERTNGRWKKVC